MASTVAPSTITVEFKDATTSETSTLAIPMSKVEHMETLKNLVSNYPDVSEAIPLHTIERDVMVALLEKVDNSSANELFEHYKTHPFADIEKLILPANFLGATVLLDALCRVIAQCHIKGKTAEELRTLFKIENDYTPEEEAAIRAENSWKEE